MRRVPEVIVALVLVAVAASGVLAGPHALRVPAGLLLLLLPGLLVTFALFPPGTVGGGMQMMLALALALALVALAALVLDVTVGIRRDTWVVALVVIAASATGVALVRARGQSAGIRMSTPNVPLRHLAFIGLGVVSLAAAITIMRTPLHATNIQPYTALSMLPGRGGRGVAIGVESGELKTMAFRLVVRFDGAVAYDRKLPPLAPGSKLERSVPGPHSDRAEHVTAQLFRVGAGGSAYRTTSLTVGPE